MRKLIIILASLFIGILSYSQEVTYNTTFFSTADWNGTTRAYDWSDWVTSDKIPVIFDKESVEIYSDQYQLYSNLKQIDRGSDSGGSFVDFSAVDQDGVKCIVKLRIQTEGNVMQVCIYCGKSAWAYCLERAS